MAGFMRTVACLSLCRPIRPSHSNAEQQPTRLALPHQATHCVPPVRLELPSQPAWGAAGRPAARALTKPAAHCVQLFWPVLLVKRPGSQGVQLMLLGTGE